MTTSSVQVTPDFVACVFVERSTVAGAHCGVAYADDVGLWHRVHQAWHYDLRVEPYAGQRRVRPSLDRFEQRELTRWARLVARRAGEQRVPYSFDAAGVTLDGLGVVSATSPRGLTCATFVMLLWRAANLALLDEATWEDRSPARTAEDDTLQRTVVEWLQRRDAAHADALRAHGACTRFRAEEVAAASARTDRPVSLAAAEPAGAALLASLP